MLKVKCKKCSHNVNMHAQSCPNCDVKNPGEKHGCVVNVARIIALFSILFLLAAIFLPMSCLEEAFSIFDSPEAGAGSRAKTLKSNWRTAVSKDEMTGQFTFYTTSRKVKPTNKMNFPYNDMEAWLGVGRSGGKEWAYIGFSTAPNINNTDTQDGYSTFSMRTRWDEQIKNVKMTQKWGADSIHFQDKSGAISNIIKAKSVLVELDWYGQDSVYFEFSLAGSSGAISKIRQERK